MKYIVCIINEMIKKWKILFIDEFILRGFDGCDYNNFVGLRLFYCNIIMMGLGINFKIFVDFF